MGGDKKGAIHTFRGGKPIKFVNLGDGSYALAVALAVPIVINPGDINIGAVELKDADSDDRVRVALPSTIDGSDNAEAVTDFLANQLLEELTDKDFATEYTLDSGLGVYEPIISTIAVTGETPLLTPTGTNRVLVRRIWTKGAFDIPDDTGVEFILRLGSKIIAHDDLIKSQPYADSIAKLGDAGDPLTIELLSAQKIYYNIAAREIA